MFCQTKLTTTIVILPQQVLYVVKFFGKDGFLISGDLSSYNRKIKKFAQIRFNYS
jgi:hypothetical protein